MSMKAIEHLSEATTTSHARGSSKRSERSPTNCPAVRVATCRESGRHGRWMGQEGDDGRWMGQDG